MNMPPITQHGDPKQLKEIRLKLEMSQKTLAENLGVQTNTVTRWECNILPMPRTAQLAAEFLLTKHKKPSLAVLSDGNKVLVRWGRVFFSLRKESSYGSLQKKGHKDA